MTAPQKKLPPKQLRQFAHTRLALLAARQACTSTEDRGLRAIEDQLRTDPYNREDVREEAERMLEAEERYGGPSAGRG